MHNTMVGWSPDQKAVMDAVEAGKNVLFTGSAGTGKSFIIQQIVQLFDETPTILCPTATAAVNLCCNATTIHSFLGIRGGNERLQDVIDNQQTIDRVRKAAVLIIDEIGNVHGRLLCLLHHTLQVARGNNMPFGGVQLIMCGDPFQLPPVATNTDTWGPLEVYFFQVFKHCGLESITQLELKTNHRQQGGGEDANQRLFKELLSNARMGICTLESRQFMREVLYKGKTATLNPSTHLLYKRSDVNAANKRALTATASKSIQYQSSFYGYRQQQQSGALAITGQVPWSKEFGTSKSLTLQMNSPVMLRINIDVQAGLCNGAIGSVIGFTPASHGKLKKSHTLVEVSTELKLAKPVDEEQLYILDITKPLPSSLLLPVVCFGERWFVVRPHLFLESTKCCGVALPIVCCYSMTIHKSQGLTLSKVTYDLIRNEKLKTTGAAYVAFSRVKHYKDIELVGRIPADKNIFWVNETVRDFVNHGLIPPLPSKATNDLTAWNAIVYSYVGQQPLRKKAKK